MSSLTYEQQKQPFKKLNDYSKIYVYKNDPQLIGQGVNSSLIQSYEGGYIPFISDESFIKRNKSKKSYQYNNKTSHGTRPMHQTTFEQQATANTRTNFVTNNQIVYQGFQNSQESRAKTSANQFRHQFKFGYDSSEESSKTLSTGYRNEFGPKANDDLVELKQKNHENYLRNSKSEVKELIEIVRPHEISYFTQYRRIHDYLGHVRGPGVPRDYADRRAFNVLTGDIKTNPSWSENSNYKRISGNVLLHEARHKHPQNILN